MSVDRNVKVIASISDSLRQIQKLNLKDNKISNCLAGICTSGCLEREVAKLCVLGNQWCFSRDDGFWSDSQ